MRTAKILIRLGGCPGWSESSLGTQSFCWFCHVTAHICLKIKLQTAVKSCTTGSNWNQLQLLSSNIEMSRLTTKPTKQHVRPAKTQISLGIRPVWSESSLSAWRIWACVLSYPLSPQRRLWSDWVDAQADLSLCWAHSHFVGFVMRRLKWKLLYVSWLKLYELTS